MTTATIDAPELIGGHTRWFRTILLAGAPLIAVLVIAYTLISGILAATFALGGVPIQIKADTLAAGPTGLYGNARDTAGGDPLQVVSGGIENAKITGLCLDVEVPTPIGGGFTILLSAPSDIEVDGTNLVLDITSLSGGLEAHNFELGRDASQLSKGNVTGPAGSNGIQADSLLVSRAEVGAHSLSAGTIKLDQISIDVAGRDEGC